jgi:WD40 repeat protein
MQHFVDHKGAIRGAAFVGDNKSIVSGGADSYVYVNVVSLQQMHVADERGVQAMALSKNGAQYATAHPDGSVKSWDAANGKLVKAYSGLQGPALAVAFHPGNQQIAGTGVGKALLVWSASDGAVQLKFALPAEGSRIAYSPDGRKLIAALADRTIRAYSPTLPAAGTAFGPAEAFETHQLPSGSITDLVFAADNRTAITVATDGVLRTWPTAAPDSVASLTGHKSQVYSVAFSPNGMRLASASNDKTVKIWDSASGKEVKTLAPQGAAVYAVAFSPDGKTLLTGGGDKTVRLFDVGGGGEVRQFAGPEGAVYTVAFHPGGQAVAAAGVDKKIRLWNTANGQLTATLAGQADDIYRVQFNPAGTRLLSAGYSGTINVWDAGSPAKALFSTKLPVVIYSAGYFPDGKRIAATGNDGKTYIVDLPSEAL